MADRRELEESWTRTRSHLGQALALLPANLVESVEGGRLDQYLEWIEHNELGLALDELEGLGEINPVSRQFWAFLLSAALEMKLDEHVTRMARRMDETSD